MNDQQPKKPCAWFYVLPGDEKDLKKLARKICEQGNQEKLGRADNDFITVRADQVDGNAIMVPVAANKHKGIDEAKKDIEEKGGIVSNIYKATEHLPKDGIKYKKNKVPDPGKKIRPRNAWG